MDKNCNNCYWKRLNSESFCEFKKNNNCKRHEFVCDKCMSNTAEYKYKNKYYCSDCILNEFEVEECTTTQYYMNGECIGDDSDFDLVIENLDGVEEIE